MRRGPLPALVLALLPLLLLGASSAAGAGSELAQAPSGPGVGELWKEFPLEEQGSARPARPAATPARAPAQQAPQTRASGDGEAGEGISARALWIVALVVGSGVLLLLGVRRARRRRERESADRAREHSRGLYAEGFTDRDGIGSFRGHVHAIRSNPGPVTDQMLCVHDLKRGKPIWVMRSEAASLSSRGSVSSLEVVGDAASEPTARTSSI